MVNNLWQAIARRPLAAKVRRLFFSSGRIQDGLVDLRKHLERIEDKLHRIEDGMEKAGFLSSDTRLDQRHLDFKKLSLAESFDYIYRHKLWGGEMQSGPGSYGEWAEGFVRVARETIARHGISTITDVGCGDFNVGSQLCPNVRHYVALDISQVIISRNKERYASASNVVFRQANACVDPLPTADLFIIRQVLQHLTNAQVEAVLQNVERSGPRFVLIAEHSAASKDQGEPNLDLPSQTDAVRVAFKSGIFPDQPPFSRPCRTIARFENADGLLTIYLWELTPASVPGHLP